LISRSAAIGPPEELALDELEEVELEELELDELELDEFELDELELDGLSDPPQAVSIDKTNSIEMPYRLHINTPNHVHAGFL